MEPIEPAKDGHSCPSVTGCLDGSATVYAPASEMHYNLAGGIGGFAISYDVATVGL